MITKFFSQFPVGAIKRHLIVWTCVLINFAFFTSITGTFISKIVWVLTLLFNFSFCYYILLLFVWTKIFDEKRVVFILSILVIIFFFSMIYYTQIEVLIPFLGGKLFYTGKSIDFLITKFLINFSYVFFSSLGSFFNWRGIKQIEKSAKTEKNIIELELIALKNQFHSHFTFNFLNFCYSRIRSSSIETANYVEDFSNILRYSLKGKAEQLVCLKEEINYIENCISFQRCLSNNVNIKFDYEGEMDKAYILPRILAVFVENSFKHGVLHDPLTPIIIKMKFCDGEFNFSVWNKKINQKSLIKSGIGLENIKQILFYFYDNKHTLKVINNDLHFLCELKIEL